MTRLDAFVQRRRAIAARYDEQLLGMPVTRPFQQPDSCSAWHLYVVRLDIASIGKTRREVFDAMRAQGIGVNVHYIPVHRQPYFERQGFRAGSWPEAERYYAEAISLPIFAALSEAQQDEVVAALRTSVTRRAQ